MPVDAPMIRILGRIEVRGRLLSGDIMPHVLVKLVLSPHQQVMPGELKSLWPPHRPPADSALEKMISNIRDYGLDIGKQRGGPYHLLVDRNQVDALRFIDEVGQLPPAPLPESLDQLLALWYDDPRKHSPLPRTNWGALFRSRDKLVELIATLSKEKRSKLTRLEEFVAIFSEDDKVVALNPEPATNTTPASRPRVIIVEDEIADVFEYALEPDYECVVAESLGEWREKVAEGVLKSTAAAIVDWHLKDGKDGGGAEVLEYLRDRTSIPVLLASQVAQPGPVHDLIVRYQLAGVYNKGPGNSLPQLRQEVARIIRMGRPSKRRQPN